MNDSYVSFSGSLLYTIVLALFLKAYGKKIIRSVALTTLSGPVLYTNLLGIFPMFVFANAGNEYRRFEADFREKGTSMITPIVIGLMLLGCIAGTGIGYSSWWCRDKVSATSFTLIGVLNKCLTVLLNVFVWDKHAAPAGIACLFLCLVGGVVYEQAPMRSAPASHAAQKLVASPSSDDENEWHNMNTIAAEKEALVNDEKLEMMEADTTDDSVTRRRG
jgi:GDP-mannose transporter